MSKIPVIGVPVLNSSYWVHRLLMSVDYPTENFVIINNNGKKELNEELDIICKTKHRFIENITVCHMPANIGVGGAWNLIIKCYMNAPYWIISNDDVSFDIGFLKEMVSKVEEDPEVGMIHGHKGEFNIGSWDLFLIRDHVIQNYGLFDENLYPAYTEDHDYYMRFIHNPPKRIMELNSNYFHGFGNKDEYYKEGSQTKKTNRDLIPKLDACNVFNIEYLTKKWGNYWRTSFPYKNPYDNKEFPLGYSSYDLYFVRKKYLGF